MKVGISNNISRTHKRDQLLKRAKHLIDLNLDLSIISIIRGSKLGGDFFTILNYLARFVVVDVWFIICNTWGSITEGCELAVQ